MTDADKAELLERLREVAERDERTPYEGWMIAALAWLEELAGLLERAYPLLAGPFSDPAEADAARNLSGSLRVSIQAALAPFLSARDTTASHDE